MIGGVLLAGRKRIQGLGRIIAVTTFGFSGSLIAFALSSLGVGPTNQLLLVAAMCVISAWLGWKLHLACD